MYAHFNSDHRQAKQAQSSYSDSTDSPSHKISRGMKRLEMCRRSLTSPPPARRLGGDVTHNPLLILSPLDMTVLGLMEPHEEASPTKMLLVRVKFALFVEERKGICARGEVFIKSSMPRMDG